jgi:uncharacterized repeat protein (TIGR03847 family)
LSESFPPEFGYVRVEALGEPGERRFRLLVRVGDATTIAWMEKIQLSALGRAIEQILQQLPAMEIVTEDWMDELELFDVSTRDQFRVGRIEVGFEEEQQTIVVMAYDLEASDEDDPRLVCHLSVEKAAMMSREAETVVSAGRPRCVLCGLPMGPGSHACAQQNGHLIHYEEA